MELAERWRESVGIRARATDTDLALLLEAVQLSPPTCEPMPAPLLAVGNGEELVIADHLEAEWIRRAASEVDREPPWLLAHHLYRVIVAQAIAGAILNQHHLAICWPPADLVPWRQHVVRRWLLAGWLIFGQQPRTDWRLHFPDRLALFGDWPLWACRRWLDLAAVQIAERLAWRGRAG